MAMKVREGTACYRIVQTGLRPASPTDLLTVAISREEKDQAANEAEALKLLRRYTLQQMQDMSIADLKEASGMDEYEAMRILAAVELGRRSASAGSGTRTEISGPDAAFQHVKWLAAEKQEKFVVVLLDSKLAVISAPVVHVGTLNASIVGGREVFREALRYSAAAIIVAHNHPSGDPTPSPEDIEVTKKLAEIGEVLDIPVHDHLIVAVDSYLSMQRSGLM